jgi:uncharacterized paraquat-inducible protein A
MISRPGSTPQPTILRCFCHSVTLVALVKLTHYGTLIPGIALWSLAVLTLLMTATASSFNVHDIWNRVHPAPRQGGAR